VPSRVSQSFVARKWDGERRAAIARMCTPPNKSHLQRGSGPLSEPVPALLCGSAQSEENVGDSNRPAEKASRDFAAEFDFHIRQSERIRRDQVMGTQVLAQSAFEEGSLAWLESRKPYLGVRTYKDYENYLRILAAFFGKMRLIEIGPDELRAYQQMRLARAGASCINKECSVLQQMLKRIGRWPEIAAYYQPLPLPKESPHRALTPQEEERLYRIGASNPAWEVAYCAFVISINTTSGPGEIRHLRRMDIDFERHSMRVQPEGAKNEHRIRVIPLNDVAWRAIEYLWQRSEKLGCTELHHYLIPFREKKGTYDPDRPAEGWRYALREMLAQAGLRISAYSFRHHAITKLLENADVSEETAEAIAGHISHRMKKRYSHTRLEVKRAAVEALQRIAPK
jgi:integrase